MFYDKNLKKKIIKNKNNIIFTIKFLYLYLI